VRPETAFLLGITLANFGLSIVAGFAMRAFHRRERDAEIREAYGTSQLFTLRWLRGESDVLPERVKD